MKRTVIKLGYSDGIGLIAEIFGILGYLEGRLDNKKKGFMTFKCVIFR